MNLIDEIASLDELCMTAIMLDHGEEFDVSKRRENLRSCMVRGDDVISIRRASILAGYVLISKDGGNRIMITSMQILPSVSIISRGLVLRQLMKEMICVLASYPDDVTVSVETHMRNKPSISLQSKLGFWSVPSSRSNRLRFQQTVGGLRNSLKNPIKAEHSIPKGSRLSV